MLQQQDVKEAYRKYVHPAVKHLFKEPIVFKKGDGKCLYDIDGKEYLDFFGGILVTSLGACHPEVNKRIKEQVDTLQHVSTLYANIPMIKLARKLAHIAPGQLEKTFFVNSGSEAVEFGVLSARIATQQEYIIALRYGYSGRTLLTTSLCGLSNWKVGNTTLPNIVHAHPPYCYRCSFDRTYPNCDLLCVKDLEELILTATSGKIAAFLAEPISGVGGVIVPPPEYFSEALNIIRKYGGLFICDEVQTGFGRTGAMFGIEHWGVQPDIMCVAKALGNGMPIGATIVTSSVADKFYGNSISTFGGNPVSCAAGLAVIDTIEKGVLNNVRRLGVYIGEKLAELKERFPCVGDVRGKGCMFGIEIVGDKKIPDGDVAGKIVEKCKDLGLLIGKSGLYGNVLRFAPPLIAEKDDIDYAISIITKVLEEI